MAATTEKLQAHYEWERKQGMVRYFGCPSCSTEIDIAWSQEEVDCPKCGVRLRVDNDADCSGDPAEFHDRSSLVIEVGGSFRPPV